MIIQCDHCSARFKMDDSKLANGPVKVRCAKCKEVFVVKKDEPASESAVSLPPEPSSSASDSGTADFSFDSTVNNSESFSQGPTDFSFDDEALPAKKEEPAAEQPDSSSEFDWQESAAPDFNAAESGDFNLSSFEAAVASSAPASSPAPAAVAANAADDNDFDFGDMNFNAESEAVAASPVAADSQPADEFSMDFGEISFSDPPADSSTKPDLPDSNAAENVPASPAAADDFMSSFGADSEQKESPPAAGTEEPENVNFGEFSFGDMDETAPPANSEATVIYQHKPAAEPAPAGLTEEYQEEELPPASLTSRKKSGPLFPVLVIIGAIVVIIALAGSGVYFFGGTKAFSKVGLGFLVEWYGDKGVEDGSITLKGVTASYVANSTSGELFVVRGEAVNNFKKPRASIQIKVSLLGTGGAPLISKSAFCGNSLSNEQLATLPLAKIEESMNNQFGDSLANLGLKPGGAIPFVIVVSPIAKDATDYTVQVVGSTVSTQ